MASESKKRSRVDADDDALGVLIVRHTTGFTPSPLHLTRDAFRDAVAVMKAWTRGEKPPRGDHALTNRTGMLLLLPPEPDEDLVPHRLTEADVEAFSAWVLGRVERAPAFVAVDFGGFDADSVGEWAPNVAVDPTASFNVNWIPMVHAVTTLVKARQLSSPVHTVLHLFIAAEL